MKIILVDDDRMALDGISRMLHWEQFNGQLVGCATNGEEAVALLEAHHPDVVISDIRMPGMDGLELARYLYEHCPNTRMILISGHGGAVDKVASENQQWEFEQKKRRSLASFRVPYQPLQVQSGR